MTVDLFFIWDGRISLQSGKIYICFLGVSICPVSTFKFGMIERRIRIVDNVLADLAEIFSICNA
jgi:hypothetical protein